MHMNANAGSTSDGQVALDLARAARNSLVAEYRVARARLKECRYMAKTLSDAVDEAHSHVQDANRQLGAVLNAFQKEGRSFAHSQSDDRYQPTYLLHHNLHSSDSNTSRSSDSDGDISNFSDNETTCSDLISDLSPDEAHKSQTANSSDQGNGSVILRILHPCYV